MKYVFIILKYSFHPVARRETWQHYSHEQPAVHKAEHVFHTQCVVWFCHDWSLRPAHRTISPNSSENFGPPTKSFLICPAMVASVRTSEGFVQVATRARFFSDLFSACLSLCRPPLEQTPRWRRWSELKPPPPAQLQVLGLRQRRLLPWWRPVVTVRRLFPRWWPVVTL